jgi:hypothetical protein
MSNPVISTVVFTGFSVPQNILTNHPRIMNFIEELDSKYKYEMNDRVYIFAPQTFKIIKKGDPFIDSSDIEQNFMRMTDLVAFKFITKCHFYSTCDNIKLQSFYDEIKELYAETNPAVNFPPIRNYLVEGSTTTPEPDSYALYCDLELPIM